MSPKNTTNAALNTPAEEGLDELIELGNDDGPATGTPAGTTTAPAGNALGAPNAFTAQTTSAAEYTGEDDLLEEMGDGARATIFLTHDAYEGMKDNARVILVGESVIGKYAGSFVSGELKIRKHKIAVTQGTYAGQVVAMPYSGDLNKKLQFVPTGTMVATKFDSRSKIKTGLGKGKNWFTYGFKLPGAVKKQIEAGELPANYELKKQN